MILYVKIHISWQKCFIKILQKCASIKEELRPLQIFVPSYLLNFRKSEQNSKTFIWKNKLNFFWISFSFYPKKTGRMSWGRMWAKCISVDVVNYVKLHEIKMYKSSTSTSCHIWFDSVMLFFFKKLCPDFFSDGFRILELKNNKS